MKITIMETDVFLNNIFSRMRCGKVLIHDIRVVRRVRHNKFVSSNDKIDTARKMTDLANKIMLDFNNVQNYNLSILKKLTYTIWVEGVGLYYDGMIEKGINPIFPHFNEDIASRDTAMVDYCKKRNNKHN